MIRVVQLTGCSLKTMLLLSAYYLVWDRLFSFFFLCGILFVIYHQNIIEKSLWRKFVFSALKINLRHSIDCFSAHRFFYISYIKELVILCIKIYNVYLCRMFSIIKIVLSCKFINNNIWN